MVKRDTGLVVQRHMQKMSLEYFFLQQVNVELVELQVQEGLPVTTGHPNQLKLRIN